MAAMAASARSAANTILPATAAVIATGSLRSPPVSHAEQSTSNKVACAMGASCRRSCAIARLIHAQALSPTARCCAADMPLDAAASAATANFATMVIIAANQKISLLSSNGWLGALTSPM